MGYPPSFLVFCKGFSLTLTSLRKAVLFVLWDTKKPCKAYDILDRLYESQPNATASAVYRALGFFVTAGMVHKLDSIQAYALCAEPETHRCSEVMMVCSLCHAVREVHDVKLRQAAEHLVMCDGFQLSHDPIELRGVCKPCLEKASH